MYEAKIENTNGDILTLTGNEPVYQIIDITGLNPPNANIITTNIVGMDGAMLNTAKLDTRNLVLMVKINGDVETNRLRLYNFFRTKAWCKFYYSNDTVNVSIEGYVESVECDLFSNSETAQISIICLYPYFKGLSENITDSSGVTPQFVFPFSINIDEPVVISTLIDSNTIMVYNSAESDAGAIIEIDVNNAINSIEIQNSATGESFELTYNFLASDKIIINTNKGQKSITLVRNGIVSSLFSAMAQGSTFFQLAMGMNNFEYLVNGGQDTTSVLITFRYYNIYRGV